MPSGYVRARIESIPGNETNTPTFNAKVLFPPATSFAPSPNPAHLQRDDEIRNLDEPIALLAERYNPEWSMDCRMYPDVLGFMFTALLGQPVTTAGNGVITDPDTTAIPVGAYRHVWTAPFGPSGPSPKTLQFDAAYKDQSVFFNVKGAAIAQMQLTTPETGGGRFTANGPALYMPPPVVDPALTPTYESLAIPPFFRSHLTLPTWLTGTGTTEDVSLTISNPVEAYSSLGVASRFPDVMEKAEGPITFTGSIPKRQLDVDDLNALMAATGFPAVIRWKSTAIIASGYAYGLWVAMDNAQYAAGGPNALENVRRIGGSFDFRSTSDGVGASTTVTLVNATTSYA